MSGDIIEASLPTHIRTESQVDAEVRRLRDAQVAARLTVRVHSKRRREDPALVLAALGLEGTP